MNPFTQLSQWWQSDSKAPVKLTLWSVTVFVLIGFLFLFYSLNTTRTNPNVNNIKKLSENSPVATDKSFDEAGILEKADVETVGVGSQILFTPQGRIVFLDKDLKFRINGVTAPSTSSFFARQLLNYNGGVIINEDVTSTVYSRSAGFTTLPTQINSLTPLLADDKEQYYAMSIDPGGIYSLVKNETINFDLNSFKKIVDFKPTISPQVIEIRVFNNRPYIVAYQNFSRTGNVEIWQLNENNPDQKLKKVQSLSNIKSIKFGKDALVYTDLLAQPTDLTLYKNTIIQFNQQPDGEAKAIPLADSLGQNNILGTVAANRCTFSGDDNLLCLVKDIKISINAQEAKDSLVLYNFSKNTLSLPYKGFTFSADSIQVSPRGDVFIIGQSNRFLYKIKENI